MKSRVVVSKAVGLLALVAVLACGGGVGSVGGGGDGGPGPTTASRAPGTPSEVTVTPGDASATVSWTAPADTGGSDITEYVVRALRAGAVVKTQRGAASPLTVTELVNGESYTFTVAALNAAGEGAASSASVTVVPRRVVPGAPRDVSTAPGDRRITVAWEPPTDNGMPITGYTVRVHEGETLVRSVQVTALSTVIPHLVNGTSYLVTVVANSSGGPGPTSDPVAVTPRTIPGPPWVSSSHELLLGTTRAVPVTLSWTVPDSGGSPITGYTVVVTSANVEVHTEQTTATSVTFAKLPNGATYSATVMAHNLAGTGTRSAPLVKKLCGIPSAPQNLYGRPSDTQMALYWRPPAEESGCLIVDYRITIDGEFESWSFTRPWPEGTVTGLTNQKPYRFAVSAFNGVAHGDAAYYHGASYAAPLAPTNFQATPEDGAVLLSWTRPDSQGSTITGYIVTKNPDDPVSGEYTFVRDGQTSLRWGNLTNGTLYTFSIVANSDVGDSAAAFAEATPQAPAP